MRGSGASKPGSADGRHPEFDTYEQTVAAHESAAYQGALVALSDGVERDFRIIEGVD
ncbi:hypothetical protein [Actinoallomurus oryzae]|uniref:hypothetical protein n=1 Tax=Actinoallomurus oryzae TaxID=502180 RepID=UPI0031EE7532